MYTDKIEKFKEFWEDEVEKKESKITEPDFYNRKQQKIESSLALESSTPTPANVALQPKKLDINESDDAKRPSRRHPYSCGEWMHCDAGGSARHPSSSDSGDVPA